ncbi:MAG: hypothetical protein K6G83_03700 [Lachnospiraceae bacterium]|nr:hypothetical protein [Lachnospiraceae bacterium]
MNTDLEKVKVVFGVSEIKRSENSVLLGSKERGIVCRMSFEGDECISLRIKTPNKEMQYFPVNTKIPDMAATLYNMIKYDPPKDVANWYAEEIGKKEPAAAKTEGGTEKRRRFSRKNRKKQDSESGSAKQ